jgi:uncharacterized membrane protein (UPF0127 family)
MRTLVILTLLASCANPTPPPASSSAATGNAARPVAAAGPRVIFPDGFVVRVEIANDDDLRAQGLMFRDHLEPGTGMLFLFPEDGEYAFWMKNTIIPLDMVWIDSSRKVAHVKVNVPPCKVPDCPSYPPQAQARYVLEVAGGVARDHSLKAGDSLRFEGIDGIEAH